MTTLNRNGSGYSHDEPGVQRVRGIGRGGIAAGGERRSSDVTFIVPGMHPTRTARGNRNSTNYRSSEFLSIEEGRQQEEKEDDEGNELVEATTAYGVDDYEALQQRNAQLESERVNIAYATSVRRDSTLKNLQKTRRNTILYFLLLFTKHL